MYNRKWETMGNKWINDDDRQLERVEQEKAAFG